MIGLYLAVRASTRSTGRPPHLRRRLRHPAGRHRDQGRDPAQARSPQRLRLPAPPAQRRRRGERTLGDVLPAPALADPAEAVVSPRGWRVRKHVGTTLSELEVEVLRLHVAGVGCREIAERLRRGAKSIDNTLQRIRRKSRRTSSSASSRSPDERTCPARARSPGQPSPAMKARTASATSWTAIAESSRPAIRVTSRTPLSRISRRIGRRAHRRPQAEVHEDHAERRPRRSPDVVHFSQEEHGRDDRAGPGQQRGAERHQRDVRRRRPPSAPARCRSAAPARRAGAAGRPRTGAPAARCAGS